MVLVRDDAWLDVSSFPGDGVPGNAVSRWQHGLLREKDDLHDPKAQVRASSACTLGRSTRRPEGGGTSARSGHERRPNGTSAPFSTSRGADARQTGCVRGRPQVYLHPMSDGGARVREFHRLHRSGCFVIPNPWDLGSARLLAQLGFPALATTSSGFAWSLGRPDNHVSLAEALAHVRAIAGGVPVPVSADFEGGFATAPEEVGANVAEAAATGIAGLSIEDSSGNSSDPLFEFSLSVERVRAARRAIDESGTGVLLTGRSEGFLVGRADIARDDPPARRVRRGRGGLPVRARPAVGRRHRGGRPRRGAEAGQRARRWRLHDRCGAGGAGRPAHQRRRRPGPGRLDGIPGGVQGDCGKGDLQSPRRRVAFCELERRLFRPAARGEDT